MFNHFIYRLSALFLLAFVSPIKPIAAQNAEMCQITPVTVTQMIAPDIGSYNLWDAVYGRYPNVETYADVIVGDKGPVAVGMQVGEANAVLLVSYDWQGREVRDYVHGVDSLQSVSRIIAHPIGYGVLATTDQGLWVGLFDRDLAYVDAFAIAPPEAGTQLEANDIIWLEKAQDFVVAATLKLSGQGGLTQFYRLGADGEVSVQRRYEVGASNRIHDLVLGPKGTVYGLGTLQNGVNSSAGWIVNVMPNLKLSWQQVYMRGAGMVFKSGALLGEDTLVVTGASKPVQGFIPTAHEAAAVFGVHALGGHVVWERFYQGARKYEGVLVEANAEGTLALVGVQGSGHNGLNAQGVSADRSHYDFVRLMNFTRQGVVMDSQDYMNGRGGYAASLKKDKASGRWFLAGSTRSGRALDANSLLDGWFSGDADVMKDALKADKEMGVSRNGWILGLPALAPHKDTCP